MYLGQETELNLEAKPPETPGVLTNLENAIENIKQRPFDLYVIGPFMVWYGLRSKKMPKFARRLMVTGGIFQIWYAWRSYRELPQTIIAKAKDPFDEQTIV